MTGEDELDRLLMDPASVVVLFAAALLGYTVYSHPRHVVLVVRSLRRNLRRTVLTSMAIFVLVFVITQIWSVLWFLDKVTSEKSKDFKAIITERWQIPSQMPFSYSTSLADGAASRPGDLKPVDHMTWQFFGGTLDPGKRTFENIIFFFCMEPDKLATMMDGLDTLEGADLKQLMDGIRAMKANKRGAIIGKDRLARMNKKIGERVEVTGLNYKDIVLEIEIVGEFPPGRYDQSAVISRDYLNDAMDSYNQVQLKRGKPKHPLTDKSLNLVWLKVPDSESFRRIAGQIVDSSAYTSPAVKIETASSGVASFLDAYKDLLWGMRWLVVPAMLVIMSLVMAITISIGVRERRPEMAVMKVLGFKPGTIMVLILAEALLLGVVSGGMSSFLTWFLINKVMGGVKFPIAFFPAFFIPKQALLWGPLLGFVTAFIGSIGPAWSARTVKVSEVFSKVS